MTCLRSLVCVISSNWKPKLGILARVEAGEHEKSVVDVWVSADLAPPGSDDACNVEAKKESEQTGQFRCSSSPLSVSLLRPLSATLVMILVIKHEERRGYGAVEVGGVGGGVRADCPFAFRIVPDIVRAKKAKVPLVVKLQEVVEDEKEDRDPEHPQDGEVEGSHLTPESAGVDEAFAPFPRGPLDFASLGQDVPDPENCFSDEL